MENYTEKSIWEHALSRFQLIDWEPPITESAVNDLKEALPKRKQDETIDVWLNSTKKYKKETITNYIQRLFSNLKANYKLSAQETSACLTHWMQELRVDFNPVTEIVRYAASSITVEEYPLPNNDIPLTTEDASFQFLIKKDENSIFIEAQALGFAIERYSNKLISLSNNESPKELLAVIALSDWGKGECVVKNNLIFRKMLVNPKIGCLSD